jgi:hypothetical protein
MQINIVEICVRRGQKVIIDKSVAFKRPKESVRARVGKSLIFGNESGIKKIFLFQYIILNIYCSYNTSILLDVLSSRFSTRSTIL